MNQKEQITFLRYPGGKRRLLSFLSAHLPSPLNIQGKFIEPFVGGGSVYFYLKPRRAILSDINIELIDLYRGIKANPEEVWIIYKHFPSDKEGYNEIRRLRHSDLNLSNRAARTLFLNRTCFKGMWRHNTEGEFNVGYGGQARRWVIEKEHLVQVAKLLKRASLKCSDFECIIDESKSDDYLFLDPPYRPGEREQLHAHYVGREFTFTDHKRLARCLNKADKRGVAWSMTISGHSDIIMMYKKFHIQKILRGTGRKIGVLEENSGEVLISNHNGELK
jgi:DNA adenine methylase